MIYKIKKIKNKSRYSEKVRKVIKVCIFVQKVVLNIKNKNI